ncbi:MAG: hypothetical protein OXF66_06500 [Gammaproteobacteria bacterium]|nr:hypothetical protein [Gammaproteobacteria bacterium]MCY4164958.1 hypothetical protein [Gammaproteobacteria bacterium]MCY4255407.1 hypothetical protein [Gammaproteobacteria bacterium]MCY4340585.1 hypothetical protein [Gammaproteobacteria bacterium]
MRVRYRNLIAAIFLAGVIAAIWRLQDSEASTTLLLLTAAERLAGDSASLSAAGLARAEALSRLAGELATPEMLAGIFSAGGEPQRETVRLLSERLGQPISDVLIEDPGAFARGLARQHRGKVVVVVARAELASALLAEWDAAALNLEGPAPGRLHLISLPAFGQPRTLMLNY